MATASIRVGIGGWTYEPWRDDFYPRGLPHARELEHASRHLTAIEVNGTYYSTQTPQTYARWRDETPEGFVFTLKAPRAAVQRRVLAEAGPSIQRFVDSGPSELGAKLGPMLWQFAPTRRYDEQDLEAFLALLPRRLGSLALRHAIEVRHDSFQDPRWLAQARRHGVATVYTDSPDYPGQADPTADFVYVRCMRTASELPQGCTPAALDALAACTRAWRDGGEPSGVPRVQPPAAGGPARPRDVYFFFIAAAKERNPAAAMGLLERLRDGAPR